MSQSILTRMEPGMDWGAKRRLIAASPDQRLIVFIREGHSMGMGLRGMGQTYVPAALILLDRRGQSQHGQSWRLAEGRISNSVLRTQTKIDEAFGRQVTPMLDVKSTRIIEPA